VQINLTLPDLEAELLALLAQIPPGRVTTYGDLADALGLRSAARWVGEFLREHDHAADCPSHRVVRKGGELGLYAIGREPAEKAERLQQEGVSVDDRRVERFEELLFRDFRSTKPLVRLIDLQHQIAGRVQLVPRLDVPRLAAGLDVSYRRDGLATGACAVIETGTGHVIWTVTRRARPGLPYIPSLLTFRELPILLILFEQSRREFPELDLYFVDGNGILHPRGAGIAACFGVVANVPTIGVAKSLLCGRLENTSETSAGLTSPVTVDGKIVGEAWARNPSARPLYISPGQKIDVASAMRITRAFHLGHRLPEPLYWADRISRAESRKSGS
jgi:deoxyribonuclease V